MKPNAMTNKRNNKQDFDNQLTMFYPGLQKLSFSYLRFSLQVRFNTIPGILRMDLWSQVSTLGIWAAHCTPLPPNSLCSERTEREVICYKKSVLEPVTSVQKVDLGGQIEWAKNKAEKREFFALLLIFISGLSSSEGLELCYSFYYRLVHTRHVLYFL